MARALDIEGASNERRDHAPPTLPGVDPELVSLTADDLDELAATLEGAKSIATGLATILRQQAAAARRQGLQ